MKYISTFIFICLFLVTEAQQLEPGILLARNTNSVHENAIQFYSEIIERNPRDVESILLRAALQRALNNDVAADQDVELALAINPYSFLYLNRAERNKFFSKKSYSYFNRSELNQHTNFEKSFILANEYNRLLAIGSISEKTRALLNMAIVAMELKDFEDADMMLSAIQNHESDFAMFYDLKGVLMLENGDLEASILYFDKAIERDQMFTIAYHNRAVANKLLGNYDEASKDFDIALKQRADIAQIQFGKANLLEKMGDVGGAKYHYETAINNQMDYTEARLNYSVLLKASGEYTRALIEVNELVNEFPEDINNYYVRGGLHFIYGEYANAVKDFDEYLAQKPNDVDVLFYRGLCLVLDGSVERGCSDINVSIEKGFNNHNDLYLFMCEQ